MRTLRGRLILSHTLPFLLVVPLVGALLIYILDTQLLLTDLSGELLRQGALTADMARTQPAIWHDSSQAQQFVTLYSVRSRSQMMLLDANGNLLAASEPQYGSRRGEPMDLPYLLDALAGQQQVHVRYSETLYADIVQVLVPVVGPNHQVVGVVQLSQDLSALSDQFARLRFLILAVLGAELLLGVLIGLALALALGRSLRRVSDAMYAVASGQEWQTLPEQDPAEIRTVLRAFNTLIERLRLLEEQRRHLLANLVHELGRPIGALQSAIQALRSGADQDPVFRRELLAGMDEQVHRFRPLLDSLTDLHGQVLGTIEINRQPLDLVEWLPRTVGPWRQATQDKGLHWQADIPSTLPLVQADPDRLAQVLGNLLSNAIKYTSEGTVSLEACDQHDEVVLVVADTGIGVSPAERDLIFEPFYRSNRGRRFPQGMGLGLSIARDLVQAHGGRLEVESTPGRGSRFSVWLPVEGDRRELPGT